MSETGHRTRKSASEPKPARPLAPDHAEQEMAAYVGREELQSINDELGTVNQELKGKVEELGRANSDLHVLMDASAIATIF